MSVGERIKKIRQSKDLTQQKFCEQIGLKRNSISLVESGKRNISDQAIKSICREFNVSETWLRTGDGEMFVQRTRTDELSSFVDQLLQSEPDDIRRRFVTAISRLSTKQLEVLEGAALRLADELNAAADQRAPIIPPGYSSREELEAEADEFAAIAREQFLSEKKRELQASSAKKSGGPGGVA